MLSNSKTFSVLAIVCACTWSPAAMAGTAAVARIDSIRVSPARVTLGAPEDQQRLTVTAAGAGPTVDLTRIARYQSRDPRVARVDAAGRIVAAGDGQTVILVRAGKAIVGLPVKVTGYARPTPVSFPRDVVPVLTRAGCNGGRCHGKAEGQHGFKLSVFAFDPEADQRVIRNEAGGRRVLVTDPARSLLLLKATARLPHAGGRRLSEGSAGYRLLARWIAEGGQYGAPPSGMPTSIEIEPARPVLSAGTSCQIRVTAVGADGRRRCVTDQAEFATSAPGLIEVNTDGLIRSLGAPGEGAVVVRYMGCVAVAAARVPAPTRGGERFTRPPEASFIDRFAWDRLSRLGIQPSRLCDDATFFRRAMLDTIGTLPAVAEVRAFLAECAAERGPDSAIPAPRARARAVDRLLERPEYADYWAMRWADLLRVDSQVVTPQGAYAMTRWLRAQFAANRPYDEFARAVLLARGTITAEGPAAFYKALEKPEVMSRSISQLFLGVRIECAQCHHHPSERWTQDDYYGLAGFFTGLSVKQTSGGEAIVVAAGGGADLPHPRTGQAVRTHAPGEPPSEFGGVVDRRVPFADWMTGPQNPYFARVLVNRLWAHYFGRGLVEPVDDLRMTNPATDEPLLGALEGHLRAVGYDLKAFTRSLLNSRVYQLSAETQRSNATDSSGFSHAVPRSMPAEVLLDAICRATGVDETFEGWPDGYRAIQLWDNRLPSYFLRIFGRPARNSVCECERSTEPSIAQALHLMNSPEIAAKIRAREGTAYRLATGPLTPDQIVEELSLATLSRPPTARERRVLIGLFQEAPDRKAGAEDVLWSLLNSREFVFNR